MRRFAFSAVFLPPIVLIFTTASRAQFQAPAGYEIIPLIDSATNAPLRPEGLAVSADGELAVTNGNTVTLYNTWKNGRTEIGSITNSAWAYDTDPVFINDSTILFGENGNTDALWSASFITPTPVATQITPTGDLPDVQGVTVLDGAHAVVSGQNPSPPSTAGALYLDKVDITTTSGNITPIVSNIGADYPGSPAVTPGGHLVLLEDVISGSSLAHLYTTAGASFADDSLDNGNGYGAYGIAFDTTGTAYITTGNAITTISGIDSNSPSVSEFGAADPTYEQYFTSISFTGGNFIAGQAGDTGALILNDGGYDSGGAFAIVVPEPSTLTLLAAATLLTARRKRN